MKVLLLICFTGAAPRSTPRSKIDTEQLNKILVKMPKSQLKELITDVINIDEEMMILIKKYADGQANLRIQPFKKDWNKDYQAILSEPDSESKFKKLYHLAHDFVYAANTFVSIILHLPLISLTYSTGTPKLSFQN